MSSTSIIGHQSQRNKPIAKRIFVPLSAEPFEWFRSGQKHWELRRYGRQFTERNLVPGRGVELRRGYAQSNLLFGRIIRVVRAATLVEFFEHVPYEKVIPTAASLSDAIRIATEILGNLNDQSVIGFQVELQTPEIRLTAPLLDQVRAGAKTTTIRRGHRRYMLGPAKLVAGSDSVAVEIVEVRHTRLKWIDSATAETDGFPSVAALADALHSFYPGIEADEEVTVVRFRRE